MTAKDLAELVNGHQIARGRWMGHCPAHQDRSPSLSIRQGDKGALVCCMAGCRTEAVLQALGLRLRDLFHGPPPAPEELAAKARIEMDRATAAVARREAHGRICSALLKWERVRDELGARLARLPDNDPEDSELTRLFHVACGRVTDLDVKELRSRPDGAAPRTARKQNGISVASDNAA